MFSKNFVYDEIGAFQQFIDVKLNDSDENVYYIVMDVVDGTANGVFVAQHFPKSNMLISEYACTRPDVRKSGIASKLMWYVFDKCRPEWVFGEIEKDNSVNLKIWKKFGFKLVGVTYAQLPLQKDKNVVDNLYLAVMNPYGNQKTIPSGKVSELVYNYYKHSQFCEDPYKTKEFQTLLLQCQKTEEFELEDFQP